MPVIVQKRVADCHETQRQVAAVVVDAYWREISQLCDDRDTMTEAMRGCFNLEHFYIAYDGEDAVGVAACCPPGHRAVTVDAAHIRRVLGEETGAVAGELMRREFESPCAYGADTAYIEFVATAAHARGRGIATLVTRKILETAPFRRFVLEVTDTNETAVRLYEKLGFIEYKRVLEEDPQTAGFAHRIYMEYVRGE